MGLEGIRMALALYRLDSFEDQYLSNHSLIEFFE